MKDDSRAEMFEELLLAAVSSWEFIKEERVQGLVALIVKVLGEGVRGRALVSDRCLTQITQ
jgi:hypothetical protein